MKTKQILLFVFAVAVIGVAVIATSPTYAAPGNPSVLRTTPAIGATGVPRDLSSVTFIFSEPMDTSSYGSSSSNWGKSSYIWSDGDTVLTITRVNDEELMAPNNTVMITFSEGTYHDLDGGTLPSFTLSFTTTGIDIEKVAANPGKGFSWPYFLYVPPAVSAPPVLLVEPNNTGSTSNDQTFTGRQLKI